MNVSDYQNRAIKAVQKELGWRVNLGDVKDFSRGDDHKVFEVVHGDSKVIVRMVKLEKARRYYRVERNKLFAHLWACKQWAELNVPVPKTIAYNKDYIIEERVEGTDFDRLQKSKGEREILLVQLGRLTRKMHKVKVGGYWEIVPPGRGRERDWKGEMDAKVRRNLKCVGRYGLLEKDFIRKLKTAYEENINILEFKGSSLLHGDLNMQNIIINNGRIAAVIDAGDAMAGDPMYEIARYQYENRENLGGGH